MAYVNENSDFEIEWPATASLIFGNYCGYDLRTDNCKFPLTSRMKDEIVTPLKHKIKNSDFYKNFSGSCFVKYIFVDKSHQQAFLEDKFYDKLIFMKIIVTYKCMCSGYGSPGVEGELENVAVIFHK